MADVGKAAGTVEFCRAQLAEAERSLSVRKQAARDEKARVDANVAEAKRIVADAKANLKVAEADLDTARAEAANQPPPIHQAGGSGAAYDATVTTVEG